MESLEPIQLTRHSLVQGDSERSALKLELLLLLVQHECESNQQRLLF
jgi:hypothetical protein